MFKRPDRKNKSTERRIEKNKERKERKEKRGKRGIRISSIYSYLDRMMRVIKDKGFSK